MKLFFSLSRALSKAVKYSGLALLLSIGGLAVVPTLAAAYSTPDGATGIPTVTGANPGTASGPGATTIPLTITGTNFIGASSVELGETPVPSFSVVSNTEIVATAPAQFQGGAITVTGPLGTSSDGPNSFVCPYGSATPQVCTGAPAVAETTFNGYRMVASDGGIFSFGNEGFYGSTGAIHLTSPIVGMASTEDGRGYWLVASDGGVFAFGDATFSGSVPQIAQVNNVVGIVPDPHTGGYWIIAANGGVYAFNALNVGSLPVFGIHVDNVVGGASSPDGGGLYVVTATGAIYSLIGDAVDHGSVSSSQLKAPVVGMATDNVTGGYWVVSRNGDVFSFDAPSFGDASGVRLTHPIIGIAPTNDDQGYWLAGSDGGIFTYGDASYMGSEGGTRLNKPIVGIGASPVSSVSGT